MNQKRVGNKLYVLDMTPYVITEDTDADIIYVQQEKLSAYLDLNPTLESKIKTINYLTFSVRNKEWAEDAPTPSLRDPEISWTVQNFAFEKETSYDLQDYINNPNQLDYTLTCTATNATLSGTTLTTGTTAEYGFIIELTRAADATYDAAFQQLSASIIPGEDDIEDIISGASGDFNDEGESLELYITPEILSEMNDEETDQFVKNLIDFRETLQFEVNGDYAQVGLSQVIYENVTVVDDEHDDVTDHYYTYWVNDAQHEAEAFALFSIIYEYELQHYQISLAEGVNWVNVKKPASDDIYHVVEYAAAAPLGSYESTVASEMFETVGLLTIYEKPFKFAEDEGHYANANGWVRYNEDDEEYYIYDEEIGISSLPLDQTGYKSVLMIPDGVDNYTCSIEIPQDETWFAEMEYTADYDIPITNAANINAGYLLIPAETDLRFWLNGAQNQPWNMVDAISGLSEEDLERQNQFAMPENNVSIALRYDPKTQVYLSVNDVIEYNGPADGATGLPAVDVFTVDGDTAVQDYATPLDWTMNLSSSVAELEYDVQTGDPIGVIFHQSVNSATALSVNINQDDPSYYTTGAIDVAVEATVTVTPPAPTPLYHEPTQVDLFAQRYDPDMGEDIEYWQIEYGVSALPNTPYAYDPEFVITPTDYDPDDPSTPQPVQLTADDIIIDFEGATGMTAVLDTNADPHVWNLTCTLSLQDFNNMYYDGAEDLVHCRGYSYVPNATALNIYPSEGDRVEFPVEFYTISNE